MLTGFQDRLLTVLFKDHISNFPEHVVTYVFHSENKAPLFSKTVTDEVLEYASSADTEIKIYLVTTNGDVNDVTATWTGIFDKLAYCTRYIDQLIRDWNDVVPDDLAMIGLRTKAGVTYGYYPTPNLDLLKHADSILSINSLSMLAIDTTGVVTDMTKQWMRYLGVFETYQDYQNALDTLVFSMSDKWIIQKQRDEEIKGIHIKVKPTGMLLGSFPEPSYKFLQCADGVDDLETLHIQTFDKFSRSKEATTQWIHFFKKYKSLRWNVVAEKKTISRLSTFKFCL
jgi:hypothetical protein